MRVSPDWAKYCIGGVSAAIWVAVGSGVGEGVGVSNIGVGVNKLGSVVAVAVGSRVAVSVGRIN